MKLNYKLLDDIYRIVPKTNFSVGKKLKEIRVKYGYSSKELANILFVEPQQILRYEKDEQGLSVKKIHILCELFSIDANELLGIEKVCVKTNPKKMAIYIWFVKEHGVYWLCNKCFKTNVSYGDESKRKLIDRKLEVECEHCNELYNEFNLIGE